jgi:hypothetical protein
MKEGSMKLVMVALYVGWLLLTFLCVLRQAYRQDIEAALFCFILGAASVGSLWLAYQEGKKAPR